MDLSMDPIINFYENMLKKTQADLDVPQFSEIYLRLAFKVALGKEYIIRSESLQLYRKLLVLHYCSKYPSITVVMSIMERVFTRNEIYNIIADENVLQEHWDAFRKTDTSDTEMDHGKRKRVKLEPVINLNLIPLKEQVNVIWLSKVIFDRDQLENKSLIPSSCIKYILSHEAEILTRWLKASKRSKADRAINNIAESYRYRVIDSILGEWIHRSNAKRSPRTIQPLEIEEQANLIKRQLGVSTYYIGMYIWNKEFMSKAINVKSDSLDTAEILEDIKNEVLEDTYTEFKEKLREFHLKQINDEGHQRIETKDQRNCFIVLHEKKITETADRFNVSHDKHITETTDSSGASIASINVEDLTERNAEECGDQQNEDLPMGICEDEDLTSISSDSKELELPSSSDSSQTKDRDVIFVIDELEENEDNKDFCHTSSSKHESETMELSSEHDENSNIDLLVVLREEEQTQDSSHQSTFNISKNAANLNVDEVIEIEESSNPPQHGDQSIVLQTTDSIEELVKKYEMYNKKQQYLSLLASNRAHQQHYDNKLFRQNDVADGKVDTLNDKQKSDNNILPNSMEFGFLMQKKICIEECSRKNSTDVSNDTKAEDNRMKSENPSNTTTAHLNKEDGVIATLDDEIMDLNKKDEVILTLDDESESLNKEDEVILTLDDEIMDLNKKDEVILTLDDEITNLNKEDEVILTLDDESENLKKEDAVMLTLGDDSENLNKEDAVILTLDDEIMDLNKKDEVILTLDDESENLKKEDAVMLTLGDEITNLNKEDAVILTLDDEITNLNKEDEVILTLDDESENSNSEEYEYSEHVTVLEIVSDEEDCTQSTAKRLTLLQHTNLNEMIPTVAAYTTATETSNLVIKSNAEAFSYLSKLREFCCIQKDRKAFEIVTNLQMEFSDSNI